MRINDIRVKDIMKTGVIDISPEATLSEARSKMLANNVHQLPVTEKNSLIGVITYKSIIDTGAPIETKVSSVCSRFQSISPEDKITSAAKRMLDLDIKALPVMEKKRVVGIISVSDILPLIAKAGLNQSVETIMTAPITIRMDEKLGRVKALMRDHDISVLPILGKNDEIFGAISFFDFLRAFAPKESQTRGSKDKTLTFSDMDASSIAGKAVSIGRKKTISEAARVMGSNRAASIIVEDGGKPVGVVAQKDMLELIASSESPGIYVQITNRAKMDEFTKEKLDDIVQDSVQKIGEIFEPRALFLHIKTHEKGGRTKYSVRMRLKTASKTFSAKAWGWQLLKVVTDVLSVLEKSTIKRKEKGITRRRNR